MSTELKVTTALRQGCTGSSALFRLIPYTRDAEEHKGGCERNQKYNTERNHSVVWH